MTAHFDQNENKRFKKIFSMWVGSFGAAPDGSEKMSVDELATITGVKKNTVKGHLAHDGTMPTVANLKMYMKALPVGFTSAVFHDCGLEVKQAEEHELPDSAHLMAEMAQGLSRLAKQLEDGNHTDDEKRAIAPFLLSLGPVCTALGHEWSGTPHVINIRAVG